MNRQKAPALDARARAAIEELESILLAHYPDAVFSVQRGVDDPEGIEIWSSVDLDDTDLVLDCVIDRVMELQIEAQIPIHVIPVQPPERALAIREEEARSRRDVSSAP